MAPKLIIDNGVFCEPVTSTTGNSSGRRISRVPCKARGISENHTAWNSYIDIPISAQHGDELSCSNILCASSGRKFRYCAMCALPVASRNFSKRHSHGMVGPPRCLMNRTNEDNEDEYDEVPAKKARMGENPRTVEAPDQRASSLARVEFTCQEQKFLDLMKSRPPDDSPHLSSWIQAVLETSYVSAKVPKQTTYPESLNVFECYERDQLQDAVLEDDDDDDEAGTVDSGFVFQMGGEWGV